MYLHKVMRVNYTTYDMRRDQDSINPRTHPDIMMLAPSGSSHPYLYARVIAIVHVNAYRRLPDDTVIPEPELLHVLWVRWYDLDTTRPGGFEHFRPHRLAFAALDSEPFGFISPQQVLRGAHIQPAAAYGRSPSPSLPYRGIVRVPDDEDDAMDESLDGELAQEDWNYYYVGMYVASMGKNIWIYC